MSKLLDEARAFRKQIDNVAENVSDSIAVANKNLYEEWKESVSYAENKRVRYADKLYKCRQAHTSEAQFTPDLIPALWVVIDEEHAGTIDDPIPAVKNMEYVKGLYYIEDGNIYLMNREGMEEGEKVTLAYLPSELVGQYFELVTQL